VLIGSHATVKGGLAAGPLGYAEAVGAEVIQVFVSNPRGWARGARDPVQDAMLRDSPIPVFVHAPYLINLGSADPAVAGKSAEALAHALRRGGEIGARGVVVHTGSAVGWAADRGEPRELALRQVAGLLLQVLDTLGDGDPDLLLGPMAGQGQCWPTFPSSPRRRAGRPRTPATSSR
jgi:deoxyribonuclease-4